MLPEQTNLAGQVRTEINCLPVENQEHQEYLEKLAFEILNKRPKTQFIDNPLAASGGSLLNPGVLGPAGNFGSFTVGYPTLSIYAFCAYLSRQTRYRIRSESKRIKQLECRKISS